MGSQGNPSFPAGGTFAFAVARFNANGSLDTSFGSGGHASVEFFAPPMEGTQEFADAVLVQPDGKILVAGVGQAGPEQVRADSGRAGAFQRQRHPGHQLQGTGGTSPLAACPMASPPWAWTRRATSSPSPSAAEFQPLGPGRRGRDPRAHHRQLSRRQQRIPALRPVEIIQANGVTVAKHDVDVQAQRFNADGSLASASPAFDYSGHGRPRPGDRQRGAVAVQANGQAVAGGAHAPQRRPSAWPGSTRTGPWVSRASAAAES